MNHKKAQHDKKHNNDIYDTKMPDKADKNKILNNKRLFFCSYIEQHLRFERFTRSYNKKIFAFCVLQRISRCKSCFTWRCGYNS